MLALDFRQPVSIDSASPSQRCEWCGKPAVYQLTAVGGLRHNEGGFFCQTCGEAFVCTVAETLDRVITADVSLSQGV